MLETKIIELPKSKIRIECSVSPDEVERVIKETAELIGKQIRIPGFRKGQIPTQVVIQRVGRDEVLKSALQPLLQGWYEDTIETAEIIPVSQPQINIDELPKEGDPLIFDIEVFARPLVKLGQYKGLEVPRREPQINFDDVDAEIERRRRNNATLKPTDRPAQMGDQLFINFAGRVRGKTFPGSVGHVDVVLGSDLLLPGLESGLVGSNQGDQVEIEVELPESHPNYKHGPWATFRIIVGKIEARSLPDDDALAEAFEFKTLEELRDDIISGLWKTEEDNIEKEFRIDVVKAAIAASDINVSYELVQARSQALLENEFRNLETQGFTREDYLNLSGKDEDELVLDKMIDAADQLQQEALLDAIIATEEIDPSEDDFLEALRPEAERDGIEPSVRLAKIREEGQFESFKKEVAARQAIQLIVDSAIPY